MFLGYWFFRVCKVCGFQGSGFLGFGVLTAKAFWCFKVRVCQWFLGFVVFRVWVL